MNIIFSSNRNQYVCRQFIDCKVLRKNVDFLIINCLPHYHSECTRDWTIFVDTKPRAVLMENLWKVVCNYSDDWWKKCPSIHSEKLTGTDCTVDWKNDLLDVALLKLLYDFVKFNTHFVLF
jgi:hypothetical protein